MGPHLLDRPLPTEPSAYAAEIVKMDEERFIERAVADSRVADREVQLPGLPALELALHPQETMYPVQLYRIERSQVPLRGVA